MWGFFLGHFGNFSYMHFYNLIWLGFPRTEIYHDIGLFFENFGGLMRPKLICKDTFP